jgi:anti-sigma regulatory factor (Ser/Thr protein kinase)
LRGISALEPAVATLMKLAGPMDTDASSSSSRVMHAVALYESGDDLRQRVLPYLRDGLAKGEITVAVVSECAAAHLREGLGADHREVQWELPGVSYHSIGPLFDGLRRYLADQREAGNTVRLLAENDTTGNAARTASYLRFEAASNDVLGAYGFPWICLYDRRRYPDHVLEHVRKVHPYLLGHGGRTAASSAFVPPTSYLQAHPGPLSAVPPHPALDIWLTATTQLVAVRRTAVETARSFGMTPEDGDDFELATAEVLTNAVRHGEQPCRVRLWTTPGHVVLRVDDQGPGDDIPTKGFRPPNPAHGHLGGMGIWMMRQLADAVQIETGAAGTAVELQFPRRA